MSKVTANYDESWKEALSEYFDSFLSFFFPNTYDLVDWSKTPVPLEQELRQVTAADKTKIRVADKLYKVWLREKPRKWFLIHIEVQSQYRGNFSQRVYIYNYRIFNLYYKRVLSLVILGDERSNWRPGSFEYDISDGEVNLKFPSVKLLDYESRWDELESSNNPFAIITMAHLKTLATTRNLVERAEWKWILTGGGASPAPLKSFMSEG